MGAVRLKCTAGQGVLESGSWPEHGARRHGVGAAAVAARPPPASDMGASTVQPDTTACNFGAIRVLRRLGFSFTHGDNLSVAALARLDQPHPVTGRR